MNRLSLSREWFMRRTDWEDYIQAKVPGSIYKDLINAGKLPDNPYYRDNSRIFKEKDEFYNPTPMFLVCAKKC